MRNSLKKYHNKKIIVSGIFTKFGKKVSHTFSKKGRWLTDFIPTALLNNIEIDDEILCDHLWISFKKDYKELNKIIKDGDVITFEGLVVGYYRNDLTYDYSIEKIKILSITKKDSIL